MQSAWGAVPGRFAHLALAVLLLAVAALPSLADDAAAFADGLAAYDGGDYAYSFAQWRPLAEAGYVDAQVALAGLYAQGLGVARDQLAAADWYRRAAERGHVVAQINFADLLATGRGVTRDRVRAYAWFSLAADAGQPWARQRLDELRYELAPDEIRAAERVATGLVRH